MVEEDAGVVVVLCTASSEQEAERIARRLVDSGLAACVNIVPRVRSIYRWEGKRVEDDESLLLAKTRRERFEAVRAAIREEHSYAVPEVIAVSAPAADADYLAWLRAATEPQP